MTKSKKALMVVRLFGLVTVLSTLGLLAVTVIRPSVVFLTRGLVIPAVALLAQVLLVAVLVIVVALDNPRAL